MPPKLRTRVAPPPRVFQLLCGYCGLPPPLLRAWWKALQGAQWSVPLSFRQHLLVFESERPPQGTSLSVAAHAADTFRIMRFWREVLTPTAVVAVIEALQGEGRLTPPQARAISTAVLNRVRADGLWT